MMLAVETPPTPQEPSILLKLANLTEATDTAQVRKLESSVKKVVGVTKILTNKKKGELQVSHKPETDVQAIRKAVTTAGFSIVDPKPSTESDGPQANTSPHTGGQLGRMPDRGTRQE